MTSHFETIAKWLCVALGVYLSLCLGSCLDEEKFAQHQADAASKAAAASVAYSDWSAK